MHSVYHIYYLLIVCGVLLGLTMCSGATRNFEFSTASLPVFGNTEPAHGRPRVGAVEQRTLSPDDIESLQHYASTRENPETMLIRDLFSLYDDVARPVLNMSKSVEVHFGYRLLSIQLNEVDQLLTSFVWLPHRWTDERLTWDPLHYGNITTLIIPNRMLWLPDTFLYQSSDDTGYVTSFDRVPLDYNGLMEWWPSATLLSPCIIDVTYFPFDYQQCSLTIGPWGYHSEQVNYTLMDEHANLDRYTVSGAWELLDTNISREVQFYPDLNMSYTLIDITIKLKRKALYYWLNIIIPCILLNSLGLGLFILPADSGEKVSFGLGILLTVFVFAILVNENIPKTSDYTPVMGIYLVIIMSMISLSLFLAIIIENLHHRRPKLKPVPKWLKIICLDKLPKLLRINLPTLPLFTAFTMQGITPKKKKRMRLMRRLRQANESMKKEAEEETRLNIETEDTGINSSNMNGGNNVNGTANPTADSTPQATPRAEQTEEERLQEAYKNMPFDERDNDEWILVALVMDNLLGWIFLALLIMTTSMVLIIVPVAQSSRHR